MKTQIFSSKKLRDRRVRNNRFNTKEPKTTNKFVGLNTTNIIIIAMLMSNINNLKGTYWKAQKNVTQLYRTK